MIHNSLFLEFFLKKKQFKYIVIHLLNLFSLETSITPKINKLMTEPANGMGTSPEGLVHNTFFKKQIKINYIIYLIKIFFNTKKKKKKFFTFLKSLYSNIT
eukprot:Anaeramoba_flamelloidesa838023_34.p2 GENE.a838023_34~~a838023_34.p2  ORF type:complete len:101 (+),score=12.39 a838023_34:607-909(+)